PMFISVIFQQMYSIFDSIIAGKFAGEDALAAVGASYPITMIFMAFAVGCNVGCAVVISQYFGAKNYEKVKTASSTTIISCTILAAALTIPGLLFSSPLMKMINTPENIFRDGELYLKIYIAGLVFLFLYNVCTGIYTSLGDSKTPLYLLIGSSVGNIVLDYVFVAVLKWGVAGVAWATFIAQGAACILALLMLRKKIGQIVTERKPAIFSSKMLGRVALYAIPSILQQSFVSVGNIFVQYLVNGFGSSCIAGYSSAIKLNTFAITSFSTLSNGLSSYVAQNYGAGKTDRIKSGYRAGLIISSIVAVPFIICYFFFPKTMINCFLDDGGTKAVEIGMNFLHIVAPFYIFVGIKIMSDGALRGKGAMQYFMITTFSDLILRVVLAFILAKPYGSTGIWLSWPIGWTVSTVLSVIFVLVKFRDDKQVVKENAA
ncbi:MAG: MATE family efflux transporter, partial [Oscillospiraceae bacterium]